MLAWCENDRFLQGEVTCVVLFLSRFCHHHKVASTIKPQLCTDKVWAAHSVAEIPMVIQSNLSTMTTLGAEFSGHCNKRAIVAAFKGVIE